jgi:hypothetical protein
LLFGKVTKNGNPGWLPEISENIFFSGENNKRTQVSGVYLNLFSK